MNKHRTVRKATVCAGLCAGVLLAASALGSGSISAGGGGIGDYASFYAQGKKVFFGKLACSRAECPIKRREVDASLAASVVRSVYGAGGDESRRDAAVGALTTEEQQMVVYYLSRRFGIER